MSLCIVSGGEVTRLAASAFMLAWTHSVEKIPWQEDWLVSPAGLSIVEARVKGTGAGMEMPEEARFDGQWWRWAPAMAPLRELRLARSSAVPAGWRLCVADNCHAIAGANAAGDVTVLMPCE